MRSPRRHIFPGLLTVMLLALAPWGRAGEWMVDDFDADPAPWTLFERFGGGSSTASLAAGRDGQCLAIQYTLENAPATPPPPQVRDIGFIGAQGFNHVCYARQQSLNLSFSKTLSFDVKAAGSEGVYLFLVLWDGQGRASAWGIYGGNFDFTTSHADWHTCQAELNAPMHGSQADLRDVRCVGLLLHAMGSMGASSGTVWLDNVKFLDDAGKVELAPQTFSPNGDGYHDMLKLALYPVADSLITVEILDAAENILARPFAGLTAHQRVMRLLWDGRNGSGHVLPDGAYTLRASYNGSRALSGSAQFIINTEGAQTPITYDTDPFFPIGVWFEGSPANAGYTDTAAGAKAYYDRCFADLAAHGFNCVAVPNCPQAYWTILLQSAQDKGVRVVLEVYPLVALVSQATTVSLATARTQASLVYNTVKNYPSLLRYQIRDEPVPSMIANWITVQRAMWELDQKHPVFSCFLSWDSLELLADQTLLTEAVFDDYPLSHGTPVGDLGLFLPWLDAHLWAAQRYPPWAVLQAFESSSFYRYPTPEELRAMTWLSLASGVKGVFYFIYNLGGMVDSEGEPKPIYAPASQLANELKLLAPLLLKLRPGDRPHVTQGEARVGGFTDEAGNRVLIAANHRADLRTTVHIERDRPGVWRDALNGQTLDAPDGVLNFVLGPGEGRVLIGTGSAADGWWLRE